jgi:hypothetical protein
LVFTPLAIHLISSIGIMATWEVPIKLNM